MLQSVSIALALASDVAINNSHSLTMRKVLRHKSFHVCCMSAQNILQLVQDIFCYLVSFHPHTQEALNLSTWFNKYSSKMHNSVQVIITWLFSTEAVCLSHMALISIPLSRSLSPCRKNSSMILSVHCWYNGSVLVGLLRSAQCTMFLSTWKCTNMIQKYQYIYAVWTSSHEGGQITCIRSV